MKKILIVCFLCFLANSVQAGSFDNITDITDEQKTLLNEIQIDYEKEFQSLEKKFENFSEKLDNIKTAQDKTKEQIDILSAAYERNLIVIRNMQEILSINTDNKYKEILTKKQYSQYRTEKNKINDCLDN